MSTISLILICFFLVAIAYVVGLFIFADKICIDGYYEIEPGFAETAGLDNMSILIRENKGVITTIGEEEIMFTKEGNVFHSIDEHALTNKPLTIYYKDGILNIYSQDVHLACFVKDNMVSLQLLQF